MNNRGQLTTFFVTLMIGLVVIIIAMAFAPLLQQMITGAAQNSTSTTLGLNCTSPVDSYRQGTCMISDISLPAFIGALIFAGGAIIGARLLVG